MVGRFIDYLFIFIELFKFLLSLELFGDFHMAIISIESSIVRLNSDKSDKQFQSNFR